MADWIKCSERMPDEFDKVLLVAYGKVVYYGWYCGVLPNNHETWRDSEGSIYWDDDVTHWMPLPEPPKEVQNVD